MNSNDPNFIVGHQDDLARAQEDEANRKKRMAATLEQANTLAAPGMPRSQLIGGGAYASGGGSRPAILVNPHWAEQLAAAMSRFLRQPAGQPSQE